MDALFDLLTYSTYDLTNFATLKDWFLLLMVAILSGTWFCPSQFLQSVILLPLSLDYKRIILKTFESISAIMNDIHCFFISYQIFKPSFNKLPDSLDSYKIIFGKIFNLTITLKYFHEFYMALLFQIIKFAFGNIDPT